MKHILTILGLLRSFTVFSTTTDYNPNAPYIVQPYNGEITIDLALIT
jgi:hypothetical protein